MGKYIGESVLRKEDPSLVTGEAKYLEDIQLYGMVHAVVKLLRNISHLVHPR